jgi:hypothetical protein
MHIHYFQVEFPPEEALERRVQARLGTALRDNATVIVIAKEFELDPSTT